MGSQIEWDPGLPQRFKNAITQAQRAIDSDALMYSMKYSRQRTGALRDSALLHTVIGSGEIRQSTPYAREVYYGGGRVNLSVNPFARRRWFEAVSANHKAAILKHAQSVLDRAFGG